MALGETSMDAPLHEFITEKRDFLDAQRLHRRNRPWKALLYYTVYYVVPALCGVALVYFGYVWLTEPRRTAIKLLPLACAALYFGIVFFFLRILQIRKLWNAAQPKKFRGKPVTLQFDSESIVSARPDDSEGRFFWKTIEDYAEDERLALLYVRPNLFLYVPKRVMSEAEWDRLRALALPRKVKR